MEYTPGKCKRKRRKLANIFDDLFHICSQSSLSSNSDLLKIHSSNTRKAEGSIAIHQKRDYLTRLIERKKLKDKSLSKQMKTPYDRKLNKTCWPIKLAKVSKIKTRPQEKKKKKPTHRSLTRKKFSSPTLNSKTKNLRDSSSSISYSDSDLDDEYFKEGHRYYTKKHFFYEPVTLQMLMDVLQDPEHLKSGATLEMIIAKLRQGIANVTFDLRFRSTGALKLDLNPALDLLREEIIRKLNHGITLGLVTQNDGYYKVADNSRPNELSRTILTFGSHCSNCYTKSK